MYPFTSPYDPPAFPAPRQPIQTLSPDEEQSLLGRIGGNVLSGLGYAGGVLEKTFGGRAIRGLLGGKPRELLSVLPGSDVFGWTNYEDRVTGRDLLQQVGFDPGEGWGGTLAGIGAELATDPSMWISGLGTAANLTKAGQVAKMAGILPTTARGRLGATLGEITRQPEAAAAVQSVLGKTGGSLATLADEPLAGLASFNVPFGRLLGVEPVIVGQGQAGLSALDTAGKGISALDSLLRSVPAAGKVYGKAVDWAGAGLDKARLWGRAAFDPSVMSAPTEAAQEVASAAHAGIRPDIAAGEMKVLGWAERMKDPADKYGQAVRKYIETGDRSMLSPEALAAADEMKSFFSQRVQEMQGLGIDVQNLDDIIGYAPRYTTPPPSGTTGGLFGRRATPTTSSRIGGRKEFLQDIPGGTDAINKMAVDPLVHQGSPVQAAAYIRQTYLNPAKAPADALRQSEQLVDYVRSLGPDYASNAAAVAAGKADPLLLFGNHPLVDTRSYLESTARLKASAEAIQRLYARAAQTAGTAGLPADTVSAAEALRRAGLTFGEPVATAAAGTTGAQARLLDYVNELRSAAGQTPISPADFGNLAIPTSEVAAATRIMRPFQGPEYLSDIIGRGSGLDWLTNLTKAWQTSPFPGFHVRNLGGGQVASLQMGQDISRLPGDIYAMKEALAGRAIPGKTLEETKDLLNEMYAWRIGVRGPNIGSETVGAAGRPALRTAEDLLSQVPGTTPLTLGGAAKTYIGRTPGTGWNPLDIQTFAPIQGGQQVGELVEGVNRGSQYLSLRAQGWTPQAAADQVLKTHFDYSNLGKTELERTILSRIFPFYTYAKGNLPLQLSLMAQYPGGLGGTIARISQDVRAEAGVLPEQMGGGLAIPLGAEEDGKRRFLTRLDLPPEQALELLKGGPRGPQNTLMAVLAQLNPLIRTPLEWATGRQFFTGRELEDLRPMSGFSLGDQLIGASPLSRIATTARTLASPTSWQDLYTTPLNLGTGLRLTDVDLQRTREQLARKYIEEALSGQPEISKFETLAVRPGMQDLLDPYELELLRLNKTFEKQIAERKKQGR